MSTQLSLHLSKRPCWLSCLHAQLSVLHVDSAARLLQQPLVQLVVTPVLNAAEASYAATHARYALGDVSHPDCPHRRLCKYYKWFDAAPVLGMLSKSGHPLPARVRKDIVSFVMGSSLFAANAGSFHGVPFAQRHCALCGRSVVQDELHVLFDCPHDDLDLLRSDYQATCLAHATQPVTSASAALTLNRLFQHVDGGQFVHEVMTVLRTYPHGMYPPGVRTDPVVVDTFSDTDSDSDG